MLVGRAPGLQGTTPPVHFLPPPPPCETEDPCHPHLIDVHKQDAHGDVGGEGLQRSKVGPVANDERDEVRQLRAGGQSASTL